MSTLSRLEPVERSPLWDQAYRSLRDSLMSGRFAPGQKILLRDIAEQLGISLTPVRDAVNRLVAERVLERGSVGQGGGATVPLLSADQFRQLMEVRAALEPVAATAAARYASGAIAEAGVPGYEANSWVGIVAPAGTPPAVIDTIDTNLRRALDDPEIRRKVVEGGGEAQPGGPQQFRSSSVPKRPSGPPSSKRPTSTSTDRFTDSRPRT